ncbi:MAG: Bug family tripartite tricarboxylate transporter substrate binding protein [Xanthobacteraceae bacterium]
MDRRTFLTGAAALGLGIAGYKSASALSFPSRVIRIIVPAPASSPPDILGRIVANALADDEGWKVIVEDKPGAAQTIGTNDVFQQPADGYTLLAATTPIAAIPGLVPNAPFHVATDFAPVIEIGTGYNVLVVGAKVPVHSVAELVAYLKKDPGKYTFSSGGFGTPAHLLGELFMLETGVKAIHVPYNHSSSQMITDLVTGVNTFQFITLLPVVQFIKAGKLRALAVMGSQRLAILPNVPTIIEAGYPKLEAEDWNGLLVKSGTPPDVIVRLNKAINKVLKTEKVRAAFAKLGVDVAGGTPAQFGALFQAEIARWTKVIKDADIKID